MKKNTSKTNFKTDMAILKAMKDEDIDTSEIHEVSEEWFKNAKLRLPKPKKPISVRIDEDILEWLKGQGSGYQTKINAILRVYMENQRV